MSEIYPCFPLLRSLALIQSGWMAKRNPRVWGVVVASALVLGLGAIVLFVSGKKSPLEEELDAVIEEHGFVYTESVSAESTSTTGVSTAPYEMFVAETLSSEEVDVIKQRLDEACDTCHPELLTQGNSSLRVQPVKSCKHPSIHLMNRYTAASAQYPKQAEIKIYKRPSSFF